MQAPIHRQGCVFSSTYSHALTELDKRGFVTELFMSKTENKALLRFHKQGIKFLIKASEDNLHDLFNELGTGALHWVKSQDYANRPESD
jgi:hypothetical protein